MIKAMKIIARTRHGTTRHDTTNTHIERERVYNTYMAVAFAYHLIYASANVCISVNLCTFVEFLFDFFFRSMSKGLNGLTMKKMFSFVDQLCVCVIKSESKSVCHNFCRQMKND